MKGATSINVQPCKSGQSERHNQRKWELTKDQQMYSRVRSDLSHLNQSAIYEEKDLPLLLETIKANYKASKGKKMHAKATPIREGVVVIKEDTTLEDLKRFTDEVQRRWGPRCVQAYIHKDEGHWEGEEWKPNHHAHLVFDWTDAQGVTYKLDKIAMQQMQTLLAETLGMARGESSEREHLNSTQYANQQEQTKLDELKAEKETVGEEVEEARGEKREIERESKALVENTSETLSAINKSIEEAREELQSVSEMKSAEEEERDKIRQNNAVLQRDLEEALTTIEEKSLKSYQEIKEENTKRYAGGLIKGSVDFEAVSDELWRQQTEQEQRGYIKEYLQVSKHKSDRDKAIQERDKAQEELKEIKRENENLKERLLQSLGDRFSLFWEDVKRFSKNFLMAVGLWQGETWTNNYKKEEYSADKNRCVLLINGKSIDERTAEIDKRKQDVYEMAVTTSGKDWADFRFHELHKIDKVRDYNKMMDEINDIESTATRGQRRGWSL